MTNRTNNRIRRILRRGAVTVVALVLLSLGGTWAQQQWRHADALPEALAASVSDDDVLVEDGRFMTLRPRRAPERMGVVVYPGAYVDIRGYVPTLKPVAAAGYRVVIVPMPFELAVFGIDRALDVQAANPDVTRWVLVGHSVGGAMGPLFASRHPEALAGVIIWDSYPPSMAKFAAYPKPVWHIHRARPDGSPPPAFAAERGEFPAGSVWVPIRGGIHMQFGSFAAGGYQEDWAAGITREAQQAEVARATLRALEAMR
jgi:pimeloyl-ACP methyl ester carboxylesterase